MLFDMGQLLSVPFVLIGAWYMLKGWQKTQKL
jgi:prolipoprotein diacylglyceryltransferase